MALSIIKYALKGVLFVIISVYILISSVYASEQLAMESKLKSAFIYNFAKFVEWPSKAGDDPPGQPFVIGILGYDRLVKDLMAIEGKTIKGRRIVVRKLSSIRQSNDCHVIFISASEENNLNVILNAIKNKGILTVSDISSFAENGGIIGFVRVQNKIRFDINMKAAEKSGLKIRSDLLSLARKIEY